VEGTRYQYTIDKLRRFLTTTDDDYRDIEFGMLLLYAYEPTGKGNSRHFSGPDNDKAFEQIKTITGTCPGKAIIVLLLEKVYIRQNTGIRSKNEYYFGEPSKVSGLLFVGGLCAQRRVLMGAK
jgi:hypothetical protein